MAITREEIEQIREALDKSARPLIFFDGDNDGLASFISFYQYKGDGKGVMVGGRPVLSEMYLRRIDEYQPDAIFILDLAQVSQEFIDGAHKPIYRIDHHDPNHQELHLPKNVRYFNPRLHDDDDSRPVSYWAYMITKTNLWMAMTGVIGDYAWELVHEFREAYPELLPVDITDQGKALFDSELGKLIRIINFNLKGTVSASMTSVKILTRIEDPYDILEQKTSKGKYIYKKYERVLKSYQQHYKHACENVNDDKFIIYIYEDDMYSLSSDLSNEVKWRNPDKVVIIGRRHDGKVIMSLRSETVDIHDGLQVALEGLEGYGGGHPKACGAVVAAEHFDEFVEKFKAQF